jgi:hypothetical protein
MPDPRPITAGLFSNGPEGPRLLCGRCAACARLHFPAGSSCPYCGADGCNVAPVGPAASLRLFTTVTSRPPGYEGPIPYGFGVVELPEGIRIVARLSESRTDQLHPGQAMHLAIEPLFTDADGRDVLTYLFVADAP